MNNDVNLYPASKVKEQSFNTDRIKGQYKIINNAINNVATELGLFYLCVTTDKNCNTIYSEGQKCVVNLSFIELLDYIPKLQELGYEVKVYTNYICIIWR